MSDINLTAEQPKAFVTFERTIQVRPYETAKASIMIQVPTEGIDLVQEDGSFGAEDLVIRCKEAFMGAKACVLEQLGIEFTVSPELVVTELLERSLAATEVIQTPQARPSRPSGGSKPRSGGGDGPQLEGEAAWWDLNDNPDKWFDNRASKAERGTNGPDFKRKGTGEALWIKGRNGASNVPEGVSLP